MTSIDKPCTLLVPVTFTSQDVSKDSLVRLLESPKDAVKIDALKQIIMRILNGESFPKALMSVIKYCLHSTDHTVKRLTLLFWEVVERKANGKLLPEMILVCNAMKNDLEHPNEYIRGNTLKLMTKLVEPEILESLIPYITANLTHRHSYVRKNAVMALMSIHRSCPDLVPDVASMVEQTLASEYSPVCKRNALLCLIHTDIERAQTYLHSILTTLHLQGDVMITVSMDLVSRLVSSNMHLPFRSRYIAAIYMLLTHSTVSASSIFSCTRTLLSLSSSTTTVRAVMHAYCRLLENNSEHNTKLVVLERVAELAKHPKLTSVVQSFLPEILQVAHTPNAQVRSIVFDLVVTLCPSSAAADVVEFIQRELSENTVSGTASTPTAKSKSKSTTTASSTDARRGHIEDKLSLEQQYTATLLSALQKLVVLHPAIGPQVGPVFISYLSSLSNSAGSAASESEVLDLVDLIKMLMYSHANTRHAMITQLTSLLPSLTRSDVIRSVCWLIVAYTTHDTHNNPYFDSIGGPGASVGVGIGEAYSLALECVKVMLDLIGSTPFIDTSKLQKTDQDQERKLITRTVTDILPDGTYSVRTFNDYEDESDVEQPPSALRTMFCTGDHFNAAAVGASLTKLVSFLRSCCESNVLASDAVISHLSVTERTVLLASPNTVKNLHGRLALILVHYYNKQTVEARVGVAGTDSLSRISMCISHLVSPKRHPLLLAYLPHPPPSNSDLKSDSRSSTHSPFSSHDSSDSSSKTSTNTSSGRIGGFVTYAVVESRDLENDDSGFSRLLLSSDDDVHYAVHGQHPHQNQRQRVQECDLSSLSLSSHQLQLPLTGFSDPVYVEYWSEVVLSTVVVHLTITNTTLFSLQNTSVELFTTPNIEIVSHPPSFNLDRRPDSSSSSLTSGAHIHTVSVTFKVKSTETASIMGNIVLSSPNGVDKTVIALSRIGVDIVRYIKPSYCPGATYRALWAEFEWENKIPVNTTMTDLLQYLRMIISATNMRSLTSVDHFKDSSSDQTPRSKFLAANLYGVSVFGEEALMNISIEQTPPIANLTPALAEHNIPVVTGFIRIRARTQGIALGLGDKITTKQREQFGKNSSKQD